MKNLILILCFGFALAISCTDGYSSPVVIEDYGVSDVVILDDNTTVSPVIFSASEIFAVDIVSVPSPGYVVKAVPIGARPFTSKGCDLSVMPRPPDIGNIKIEL